MATLRTAAMNLLRLDGFRSIRAGIPAVMHDITALLAMAMRQPNHNPCRVFESALLVVRLEMHDTLWEQRPMEWCNSGGSAPA